MRLGKVWAHAVAEAEAEALDDAEGSAKLAIVVGISVCVTKKETGSVAIMDVLGEALVDTLQVPVELLEVNILALLCVVLKITVAILEDGVVYGGWFKFGVPVGQLSMHGLTSFAPRT